MRHLLITILVFFIFLLPFFTNWYASLSTGLLVLLLISLLYKIGKGIVLREVIAILYVFTCLVMPLVGYEVYSSSNSLSRVWVKYMFVQEDVYFSYALPAIAGFCLTLTWPSSQKKSLDEGDVLAATIKRIRQSLKSSNNKGLQIMIVGVVISLVSNFLPVALNYFAILFFFGSFAGLLYIHFSPDFKYKRIVIFLFLAFILWNALQTGMFTIVAYMGIIILSFFQLGKRTSMIKKVLFLVASVLFFVVLQNVKLVYRTNTWKHNYQGNKLELFSTIFLENLQKGNALISQDALFPLYSRTNQGYNVALVMKRIPAIRPYDNGDRLLTVFASAFVPRFLWQDKPEAGGAFNMKYYAGWTIKGWSTNVGPLGEAYGSFGVQGGIFYMLLLGFFLRWVYFKVFTLAFKTPLLICWLPLLFYLSISSAETDSLQILNSIIKSSFFLWMMIRILPDWFGIERKQVVPRARVKSEPA